MSRNEVGIFGILRAEKWFSFVDQKPLKRRFSVNKSGDDVPMGWITEFHDYDISRNDMSVDHRVAAHLKREGSGIFGEMKRVFIDRYATIGLLLLIRRIARRNYAHQGYVDKVSGTHSSHRDGLRRFPASLNRPLLLQGLQALRCGVRIPKFEVILNLPQRRRDTLIATKISAKIQNGLLVVGDAHHVHMNTILKERQVARCLSFLFEGPSDEISAELLASEKIMTRHPPGESMETLGCPPLIRAFVPRAEISGYAV